MDLSETNEVEALSHVRDRRETWERRMSWGRFAIVLMIAVMFAIGAYRNQQALNKRLDADKKDYLAKHTITHNQEGVILDKLSRIGVEQQHHKAEIAHLRARQNTIISKEKRK